VLLSLVEWAFVLERDVVGDVVCSPVGEASSPDLKVVPPGHVPRFYLALAVD
jgi:hypothetical protein